MKNLMLLLLALQLLVVEQVPVFQVNKSPPPPPDRQPLLDQARALPPEFRADALLRIAESQVVKDVRRKEELIEEAYWSGSHAHLPYMQIALDGTDFVNVNSLRANRLEALILQVRAVRAMLSIDPGKALQLFEQNLPPSLPKLTCSAVATPDVIDYYQAAVLVFAKSFTPRQRKQGNDTALLRQLVASITAPAQVAPALEMLLAVQITAADRVELLSALGAALQQIARSDREYSATEAALVSVMTPDRIRPSEADVLVPALRSYIVRHVGGNRCTENIPTAGHLTKSVEQFNVLIDQLDPEGSRYKPISQDEAKPAGDDGSYPHATTTKAQQANAIDDGLRWLTHGYRERNGVALRWTLKERTSRVWQERFEDTSKLAHDFKESDEDSPEAFFCVKSDALNLLAALAPPGPARDKAMDEYRDFVESYYPSIHNPNLWFTMFRHMLYTARFSDDPKDKTWILSQLGKSSNPIMSLYAKLEARIEPPAETYPPLHVEAAK